MRNKKLYSLTIVVTTSLLLFTGCGDKAEPVSAEPTETVSEIDVEESEETPSPTVEPTEEPVEEKEEIEEEIPSEEVEQEENESGLGYEIIPIDEVTMYCTSNSANIRKGPSTEYDIVGSLSYAEEIVVNGKVEDGDKIWYIIKTDTPNSDNLQMVSAGLLSETKPVQQSTPASNESTGNSGNSGNTSTQQPSAETQQPPATSEPAPGSVEGGFGWGVTIREGNEVTATGYGNLQ